MTSRWSSPIPEISVCPVSSLSLARNVGSCRFIISRTSESFFRSRLVSGSIAIEITVSGNSIDSRITGASVSHSVSPVMLLRGPMTPTMSPASHFSICSRRSACTAHSWAMFSFFCRSGFHIRLPALSVPE